MHFKTLSKLKAGDAVGIVSPSFVAPAVFPLEFQLGLKRLREEFNVHPVELPHCKDPNSTTEDKMNDLIQAFSDPSIKAVIATLGGDHQVEYVHKLPSEPFRENPKPFFGYSDNTHLSNFLFLNGIPSFYGGSIYTEFAMQGSMDPLTRDYLQCALFTEGERPLIASDEFNDIDLPWGVQENLTKRRRYEKNDGWHWDGGVDAQGILRGGCLESIDELLRHGVKIPSLESFSEIILFSETSEELPSAGYVRRVFRAPGERGILSRVRGVLVGRPKAWSFDEPHIDDEKELYRQEQRKIVLETVRRYNPTIPVVQNMDFGPTAPSICMPYGGKVTIRSTDRTIRAWF